MKAIICTQYGSLEHLTLAEVDRPVPKDNEVLIRIHATTVTTGDWRIQSLMIPRGFKVLMQAIYGFSRPRQPILGTQLAGTIEFVGKKVKKFKNGDQIIAESAIGLGCHAEYKCLPEDGAIVLKPSSLSYEEGAVLCFGGVTALDFLKNKGKIKAGEKVLIYGASGSVGLAAVQLTKYFGACATGVCSTSNLELVKSMGAANVIDYTKEDFTKKGETYDIILDAVGTLSFSHCKGSLKEKGRLLLISAGLPEMLKVPFIRMISAKKVITGIVSQSPELMQSIVELAAAGKFKAIIDRSFPLIQIAQAYSYVEMRHKKGNVVITV